MRGPSPLYVAAIAVCALLLASTVAFCTNTESPSAGPPSTLTATRDAASVVSRGNPRAVPSHPPAKSTARASTSPAPTRNRVTAGEAHTVAPSQGLGAGDPWPNYRQLSSEPAYVQAAAECVISHESRYAGMYQAVNPAGPWYGAYQFALSTWQSVTGLPNPPTAYGPKVQDDAFATLWNRGAGAGHWAGSGC